MKGLFLLTVLLFAAILPAIIIGLFFGEKEILKSHEWKAQYKARGRVTDVQLSYFVMWILVRLEIMLLIFILFVLFGGFHGF